VNREHDDYNRIDLHDGITARLFQKVLDHYETSFMKLHPGHTTDLTSPASWNKEEKQRTLALMASLTVNLLRGARRVSEIVGRETQGLVLDYLRSIIPALREGLGLENVERGVMGRIRADLEPDRQVSLKRAQLTKRKRELEDIGYVHYIVHLLIDRSERLRAASST
jgi:hypothetical protein